MESNKKKYKLGVICGRLNHVHLGHKFLIDTALENCSKVLVLIGSAQEYNTLRNPFNLETRIKLLEKIYPNFSKNKLIIYGLNDMTNEYDISYDWGKYVKRNIYLYTGEFADYIITGDDECRKDWFSPEDKKDIKEDIICRNKLKISATTVRGALLINNKELWCSFVPEEIFDMYEYLRNELLSIPIYNEIYKKLQSESNITLSNYLKLYSQYEIIDKNKKIEEIK